VTFVSCALVAAIFETLGFGVAASGRWVTWLFTNVEGVVFAGTAYFQTIGLIYGFMAVSAMLFSAYQGWGRAITPLFVSLLRFSHGSVGWMDSVYAIPRLDWLYYLVAGSVILAALALASIFLFWPPNRSSGVLSSGKGDR
jgi:Na+-driven multidrug efflux pump